MALAAEGVQDQAVPIVSRALDTVGSDGDLLSVSWHTHCIQSVVRIQRYPGYPIVSRWRPLGVDLGVDLGVTLSRP